MDLPKSIYCPPCNTVSSDEEIYSPTKPTPQQQYTFQDSIGLSAPRTRSACTTSTNSTAASSTTESYYSPRHSIDEHKLCPVTGRYANIIEDYLISPNVLGKGHYGTVRECTHRVTGKILAVKSVDKSKIGRLDHLEREIYFLSNIDHSSVMRLVDCYEDANFLHIITEKYMGGDLFDRILESTNSSGCFTEHNTAHVIKSLLEAVSYLHSNGIVHRDIKPENILYESQQEDAAVRLIDFGLSRTHDVKREGLMSNPVGTPYYMSPEIWNGQYDKSCDIWAVGVVTYILLCGYPPFNGNTNKEIQVSTRKCHLHFDGIAWFNKSDEALNFVECLLRRDPRKRFNAKEALCHPWLNNATQ